jgi:hypothetical protein
MNREAAEDPWPSQRGGQVKEGTNTKTKKANALLAEQAPAAGQV